MIRNFKSLKIWQCSSNLLDIAVGSACEVETDSQSNLF